MPTEDKIKRKLRAILSADVKGYSLLMSDDEAFTVKTLKEYRAVMSKLIEQHTGRVVDTPGDNLLAEFGSVVDAVQCAVEIQNNLKEKNEDLPVKKRLEFRIGVNIGDVIQDGDSLYGEGVNIAARIEGLADAGGVCISRNAYEHISNKLKFGYENIGEHSVKNISKPVGVYKVLMAPEDAGKLIGDEPKASMGKWIWPAIVAVAIVLTLLVYHVFQKGMTPDQKPASVDRITLPLPNKPSIAVLPFDNMSNDPDQEYFSDGISEDIITDLSKISHLIVIARNSSFAYKGKSVNVQQIGHDLSVRYLLEGSVRKAGNQVRINAQLIDASNGQHLWADRYDGNMSDIFALQDTITRKIISALALKLTKGELEALIDKGTDNIQAYDEFLKGWQGYRLLTKEGFAKAKIHLEKAIELDPEFARAYAALSILYWKATQLAAPELREGLGLNNRAAKSAAQNKPQLLLKKAMKKPTALAHGLMSQFYLLRYQHDEALAEIEKAVAMDPNDPELYTWLSHILWLMGRTDEAIESAEMGMRLDPINPSTYLFQLGKAYIPDGDLKKSLHALERAKRLNPDLSGSISLSISIIHGIQGKYDEARTAYEFFLKHRLYPVLNLNAILLYFPFADPNKLYPIAKALVMAGAPGDPTDYYKISKENRITGQEIKSRLFGGKVVGKSIHTGKQVQWEWTKDGEFQFTMEKFKDKGKGWVKEDVLFIQYNKIYGGLPYGTTMYKNPDGSKEGENEYFIVSETGSITPVALIE